MRTLLKVLLTLAIIGFGGYYGFKYYLASKLNFFDLNTEIVKLNQKDIDFFVYFTKPLARSLNQAAYMTVSGGNIRDTMKDPEVKAYLNRAGEKVTQVYDAYPQDHKDYFRRIGISVLVSYPFPRMNGARLNGAEARVFISQLADQLFLLKDTVYYEALENARISPYRTNNDDLVARNAAKLMPAFQSIDIIFSKAYEQAR